jgi:hypothetical protein
VTAIPKESETTPCDAPKAILPQPPATMSAVPKNSANPLRHMFTASAFMLSSLPNQFSLQELQGKREEVLAVGMKHGVG